MHKWKWSWKDTIRYIRINKTIWAASYAYCEISDDMGRWERW